MPCYEHWAGSVPESIPAIVAYLDLPILDAHGKCVGRLVSWRGQGGAGADAEPRTVTRADDLVAFDCAAGELPGIMGADVCDRIKLAVEVEHCNLRTVHVHDPPLAAREFVLSRPGRPQSRVRVFVWHKHLYELIAESSLGPDDPENEAFLASFRLT